MNLITLMRVRKLTFFELPIRVSVNGVAPVDADPLALDWARSVLSGTNWTTTGPDAPFELMAIVDEVGYSHILRRIDALDEPRKGSLPSPWLNVETLDHKTLASKWEEERSRRGKPLSCLR